MRAALIGGSGDTGQRLRRALEARGHEVCITSRRPADGDVVFDPGQPEPERVARELTAALGGAPTILYNLIGAWLKKPREAIVGGTRALVEVAKECEGTPRLVQCSATSVYGDRPGERLEETSPPAPDLEIGRIHLEAEAFLLEEQDAVRPIVLRLPHIYGPGRERSLELMAHGTFAVAGSGENFMHHLHIEDLIAALVACAEAGAEAEGTIIDVVDEGGAYGSYCDQVASEGGHDLLPRMSLDEAMMSGAFADWLGPHFQRPKVLREFWAYMTSEVRLRGERQRALLGLELRYPRFVEGLPPVFEALKSRAREAAHDHEPTIAWADQTARALARRLDEALTRQHLWARHARHQGRWRGQPIELRTRAWRGPGIGWARLCTIHASSLSVLNLCVLPELDLQVPGFGVDLVLEGESVRLGAIDVDGPEELGSRGRLEALRRSELLRQGRFDVPERLRAGFGPAPLLARGSALPAEQRGALTEHLLALCQAILAEARAADPRPAPQVHEAWVARRRYLELHRDNIGGRSLLVEAFGEDWSRSYLHDVFFPMPQLAEAPEARPTQETGKSVRP